MIFFISDPLELVNVADYFPSIVLEGLKKLKNFDDNSAPIIFPDYDRAADPSHHAGCWKPWKPDDSLNLKLTESIGLK